jgi:hypothetical protein
MRKEIQEIVARLGADPEKCALEICIYLDDMLELAGNGWFDDDEKFEKAISKKGRKVYF